MNGGIRGTSLIPIEVYHSYKILGILNPKRDIWSCIQRPEIGFDFQPILQLQPITPFEHSKFVEWHFEVMPSLHHANGLGYKDYEELRRIRKNENNKRFRLRKQLEAKGEEVPDELKRRKIRIVAQKQLGQRENNELQRRENNNLAKKYGAKENRT
uniref:Uncharacterized protein n=1 Tax=Acrobeloides nanus TaxID=290746 RepID=A0A914D147_9BILA